MPQRPNSRGAKQSRPLETSRKNLPGSRFVIYCQQESISEPDDSWYFYCAIPAFCFSLSRLMIVQCRHPLTNIPHVAILGWTA